MNDDGARDTGRLALAIGLVAAASAVSLATYFAAQGPFGTINDLGNAATGVLSGWLAWRLRHELDGAAERLALGAALAGAGLTVVGSGLVLSGTSTFFLAGLVSSVGFAGIGTWLVAQSRSRRRAEAWPTSPRRLGVAAGVLMALGIAAMPGIVLGLDDAASAPAWAWLGFVGWLGIYVLYPVWAIRTGLAATRSTVRPSGAPTGEASTVR